MMTFHGKVLVVGASGRTGLWVLRRLRFYSIQCRALSRTGQLRLDGEPIETVQGRLQDSDSLQKALNGCSAVICTAGAKSLFGESSPKEVDGDGIIRLVDAAKAVGVRKFILVSTIAVTNPFHPLNLFGGVLTQKLRSEDYLRKAYSEDGYSYTVIRPGGLKDGEPMQHTLTLDTGDKITGMVDRSDVAELCVLSLTHPNAPGKTFEVIRNAPLPQPSLLSYLDQMP